MRPSRRRMPAAAWRISPSPRTSRSGRLPTQQRSNMNVKNHSADAWPRRYPIPPKADFEAAAAMIDEGVEGRDPGRPRRAGRPQASAAARGEAAGAGHQGAPGEGGDSGRSPYSLGGIGLLGTAPSQDAMQECDTLIMAGTSFPYIEFLPKPGQAKIIQIDLDPTRIGLRARGGRWARRRLCRGRWTSCSSSSRKRTTAASLRNRSAGCSPGTSSWTSEARDRTSR